MKKNLSKWASYSVMFGLLLTPFQLGFLEIISISLIIGFFAGILNEISSELKSINNQLRDRSEN